MELDQDLLFFFAALGAFNSLLLSVYLMVSWKKYQLSYFFLGLLLMEYAIRVGFSCLYYFDDAPREFIKLGLSAHLLIGPTLVYFIHFSLKPESKKSKEAFTHLLLMSLLLVVLGISLGFSIWDYSVRYTIHAILSLYLLLGGFRLVSSFKSVSKVKWTELPLGQKEALLVYVTILLVSLGFVISLYTNYILGPVIFSALLYGAAYLFLQLKKSSTKTLSYQKKLDEEEVKKVESRLTLLMNEEKVYRDANLTLEKLSKKLGVSKYFLSQMLNDNLHKPYHEFIAEHRIEDACELLMNADHLTLEAIAYEVGFNSKSSFFSSFKKLKGATPAKFRDKAKV